MTDELLADRLRIGLLGADGRMGRAVVRVLAGRADARLAAAFSQNGSESIGADAGRVAGVGETGVRVSAFAADALGECDVLIDFSTPAATRAAVLAMQVSPCQALVTGTTGQSETELAELRDLARGLAFLRAGNFSRGVNLLAALVEEAARALPGWDVELSEAHHRHKVDSPSGTAILLGEAVAQGRDEELAWETERAGARGPGVGLSVQRAGGIVGDHAVEFASEREIVSLSHRALDRSLFAAGAVEAALWLRDRPAGGYGMRDVLGLGQRKFGKS